MEISFNASRVVNKPKDNEAITDTGTTDYFLREEAPCDEKEIAKKPIEIEMPNGAIEKSTHTCYLRIPGLPKELRKGHGVPGLSHSSLVSIKKLCKGGCKVIFKEEVCEVIYKNKIVLTGRAVGPGDLWLLPIDGAANLEEEERHAQQNPQSIAAATVYTLPYKQQRVKYMHQTFFAMPPATLEKAIANDQLKGFPCMNLKDVRRHLPPSPATPKGRMKKTKRRNKEHKKR